jgi:formylmethanofuran:tetrahydromethanopterin formyltransferase
MHKSFTAPTSSEAHDITAEAIAGAIMTVMGKHGPAALDAIEAAINEVKGKQS